MAAVGIDFGTSSSVIACARKGGIDTIINEVSNRSTPSFVSFTDKQRHLGEPAINQQVMNFKNTIGYFKNLLGRKFKEEAAQRELKRLVNKAEELPDGEIGIHVMYKNEPRVFTPLQLTAMFFQKLKLTTEKELGRELVDVVISVPSYWTHHRRQALMDAAKIAGLNCLRLINDTTAAALSWGIYRDLPDVGAEATNVVFIDYGYAHVSYSLVAFNKGKLKVLSSVQEETGARVFDDALFAHFAQQVQEKYKIDVNSQPKPRKKLEVAVERLKKTLTINSEAPIHVENLLEDRDFSSKMKRDEFEALIQPSLQQIEAAYLKLLALAGLTKDKVNCIEIVGSGWRPPAVVKAIEQVSGITVSKTLNQAECVARGCALQCAIVSPTFKVKEFAVKDFFPYSIKAEWQFLNAMSDASANGGELFKKGQEVPTRKNITVSKMEPVEIITVYSEQDGLPNDVPKLLGKWRFEPPKSDSEDTSLKIQFRLNESGLVQLLAVDFSESTWVEEVVAPPAATPAPAEGAPASPDKPDAMDTSDSPAPAAATPAPEPEKKRKKVSKTTAVPVQSTPVGYPSQLVQQYRDDELKMNADDKLVAETLEKKNELESYCLNIRGKVFGELMEFSTEKERTDISQMSEKFEEWLYEDGEDETKSVYVEKIVQIRKLGDPIENRKRESENRKDLFARLQTYASDLVGCLLDEKYSHLEQADKDSIQNEAQRILDEVTPQFNQQEAAPKHQDPVFLSYVLTEKAKQLENFARPILSKPKPKPAPETPPPTPQADQQTPQGEPQTPPPQPEGEPQTPPEQQQQQQPPKQAEEWESMNTE